MTSLLALIDSIIFLNSIYLFITLLYCSDGSVSATSSQLPFNPFNPFNPGVKDFKMFVNLILFSLFLMALEGRLLRSRILTKSNGQRFSSCSKTRHAPNEWWRVDLDDYYKVFTVVIHNRKDSQQQRIDGAVVSNKSHIFIGLLLCELLQPALC